ncbi:MAG TPA: M28 family peptidase [Bryobacteraceae bacterium]|nr:M28 family peptidase [Bryobacteraceae bacterium]
MRNLHRSLPLRTLAHSLFFLALFAGPRAYGAQAHAPSARSSGFQGTAALQLTHRATAFGERPSGSEAIQRLREWIVSECKATGGQVSLDSFTGQTPSGPVPMANIMVKFPGNSGKAVVVTGHYDTKRIPMVHFVGANDAGSSTGFLIEFARAVSTIRHPDDIYVVFFDGEEAVVNWTETDSLYGSRHLAAKWASDGTLARIKALINVDMIGDKDLDLSDDEYSSQSLRQAVWKIADQLGDTKYFRHDPGGVEDDHKPFVDAGVNAIDIIDLDYGPRSQEAPNGAYWHTAQDTMDKLSAHSFQVVGDVVLDLVKQLEQG